MTQSAPTLFRAALERWPLAEPFRITGHVFEALELLTVELERDGRVGRGEAAGVYYRGDGAQAMLARAQGVACAIAAGADRAALQSLLPPGGARNAIDCAFWDLEAKLNGRPVWALAGLDVPRPLLTTFGCGADAPERMAALAARYTDARAIKLKLTGEPIDAERVRAVRSARPDVWLSVDPNQGYDRAFLEVMLPVFVDCRVAMIEQPFPIGDEALLDGFASPIPIAADESVQSIGDVAALAGRFQVMNIKLDKCGGLTEALAMAHAARELGLDLMVGNMLGTSLAMAPACLIGQLCTIVDLDGPLFMAADRPDAVRYEAGMIASPEELWGNP